MMSYLKMGVKVLAPAMLEPANTVLLEWLNDATLAAAWCKKNLQDAIVLHLVTGRAFAARPV